MSVPIETLQSFNISGSSAVSLAEQQQHAFQTFVEEATPLVCCSSVCSVTAARLNLFQSGDEREIRKKE